MDKAMNNEMTEKKMTKRQITKKTKSYLAVHRGCISKV